MADGWDAFISYAHSASEGSAVALQRGLERFARPWYQRRAIRVFRDNNALSTNPALWPSIENGLRSASQLILLLSPRAATSPYVDREVQWWLDHKGQGSLLLVLDQGQLTWDEALDGFTVDSSVPPALRDAFSEEPRWLDFRWFDGAPAKAADPRFAEALADLSAPIRGIERDELIGEDLAQHRKLRRLTRLFVGLLVLLLLASIVASVIAVRQRDDVLRQAVTLRARQLAAASASQLSGDLRMAQLLAVQAYRTEPSAATLQVLWGASFASPEVDHFLAFDSVVTAVAASPDGRLGAAGLADGRVYTFGLERGDSPALRMQAAGRVTALRMSTDGTVVVAQTGDAVIVSDLAGSRPVAAGPLLDGDAIALSPSGQRLALLLADDRWAIAVHDTATSRRLSRHRDPLSTPPGQSSPYPQYTQRLAFRGESTLRLVSVDARWTNLDLATRKVGRISWTSWMPTSNLYATTARADYLLSAPVYGGAQVQAWPLAGSGSRRRPPLEAPVQVRDPLGLAVAPNGRFLLLNDSSSGLSVASLQGDNPDGDPSVTARVPGLNGVSAMEFASASVAVVAAGSRVAVLRIGSTGRGTTSVPLLQRAVSGVSNYARDSRSSNLAVAPDGSKVAVLETHAPQLEIVPVPGGPGGPSRPVVSLPTELDAPFGPLWLDDETVLVVAAGPEGAGAKVPAGVQLWNLELPATPDGPSDRVSPVAGLVTGGQVLIATSDGLVQQRSRAGALVRTTGVPASQTYDLGAFSSDGGHVALVDHGGTEDGGGRPALAVLETQTGRMVHRSQWPDGSAAVASVQWAGSTVLVAHVDGAVELLGEFGTGVVAVITATGTRSSTNSEQLSPIAVGANGLIGVPTRSGLQLFDLTTRQPSALLAVPPGFETEPSAYAFAPDGHTLITGHFGSLKRTAVLSARDLSPGTVISTTCATAGGSVTAEEWRRVVGDAPPEQSSCR